MICLICLAQAASNLISNYSGLCKKISEFGVFAGLCPANTPNSEILLIGLNSYKKSHPLNGWLFLWVEN